MVCGCTSKAPRLLASLLALLRLELTTSSKMIVRGRTRRIERAAHFFPFSPVAGEPSLPPPEQKLSGDSVVRREMSAGKTRKHREEHREKVLGKQDLVNARKQFRSQKTHFLCNLPLRNRLPEPGPGPKLVQIPTDLTSHLEFKPTSLDTEYKWEHHCEQTLGVHIDLVDLEAHTPQDQARRPALHPDDARLLHWDAAAERVAASGQGGKGRKEHGWLKDTIHVSNDLTASASWAVHYKKQDHDSQPQGPTLDSRMDAAEASFAAAQTKPVHKTKRQLTAEWSLPVLPNIGLWANDFVHVTFENDPAVQNPAKRVRVENGSMLVNVRPVRNEKTQSKVIKGVFILPIGDVEPLLEEGQERSEVTEQAYAWERQYHVETKPQQNADRNFVLIIDESQGSGSVTFAQHSSAKVELRSGDATAAARKETGGAGTFTVRRVELTLAEQRRRNRQTQVVDHTVTDLDDDDEDEDDGEEEEAGDNDEGDFEGPDASAGGDDGNKTTGGVLDDSDALDEEDDDDED